MRPDFQDPGKRGAGGDDGAASRALLNILAREGPAARIPEAQRSSERLRVSPLNLKIRLTDILNSKDCKVD